MTYIKNGVKYTTNNKPREVLTWHDLTKKEQAEFDYLDTDVGQSCADFVRYRGWVYDLGEFWHSKEPEWDGHNGGSTVWSAVYMRYLRVDGRRDLDYVVMATATW